MSKQITTPYRSHTAASIQSLDRALDLRDACSQIGPEAVPTAVTGLAGINQATTYRLPSMRQLRGYIERAADRRKHRLSKLLFSLPGSQPGLTLDWFSRGGT